MHAIIYTKDSCGYCHKALTTLDQMKVSYTNIDVTHDQELYQEMVERSGERTVPQIFWHVGGSDEMHALLSTGKLPFVTLKKPYSCE